MIAWDGVHQQTLEVLAETMGPQVQDGPVPS